jgi:hypothetical protein
MSKRSKKVSGATSSVALIVGLLALSSVASGQQILLDKPVRAGELIAFPDLNDENAYYYVVDKPRLATSENGKPQFSFLRYVQNVRSGAQEDELREGEGGGIVHALVSLSVSEEQKREAERDLRRLRSGARLVGPVVFRSGKFGLVTSFTNPDGGLSTQVVGLGNAPLLDGEKAAVSIQLTKLGAKILWESFQTPTPDISFSFEMEMEGFRSPKRALIEANFDQVYEHEAFGAGVTTTFLAAEIKASFDDLRRQGAIKLTQVGEDEDLEALITTAYNKIAEMMFQPLHGTGTPELASLTSAAGGQSSLLDRATSMLDKSRTEAQAQNEKIRQRNQGRQEIQKESAEARYVASLKREQAESARQRADELEEEAEKWEGRADESEEATKKAEALRRAADAAREKADEAEAASGGETAYADALDDQMEEEVSVPSFAVVAAYEMKRVRQRGTFRIDLNKYTSDSLTLRFDENIGDLRALMDDQETFRQVNLDDPLYRQREIVAFIDGLNSADFGDYVNFVSVQMRKRHEAGEETYDEVRIDRNNFSREGNAFKLLYGWKGDDDRRRWMEYEYRATWSFFGGAEVDQDWARTSSGAINLAPPYQRRTVTLEATDVDALQDSGVRAITVKVFYDLGGQELVRQEVLNASKGELSRTIELMLPANELEYDYEISWRLRGNRTVTSGRQTTTDAILFVDELPAG